MRFAKNQHRPQSNRSLTAAANVQSDTLGSSDDIITPGAVERNERALTLSTQVQDLVRETAGQGLEAGVEVVADALGVLDQAQAIDFLNDGTEEDGTRGVTKPGVELPVRFVGPQQRVAVIPPRRLRFLRKRNHVRRRGEVPVLVSPEFPGRADACLDFIDNEQHVVARSDFPERAEERGRCVVVAALGLNGLDDDGGDRVVKVLDQEFGFGEAAGFFVRVFACMAFERVEQMRKGCLGPVKGGNVQLVDRFAARGGQGAQEAAMEAGAKGED